MLALEAPQWLKDPLASFSLSYDQQRLAARYLTGLVVSSNKTISGISSVFPRQSGIALNRLLTQYDWNEKTINAERLEYMQRHNETRRSRKGVLIIDDVIVEKTGGHIPYVGKFYDHSKGRYVMGQNVVEMHYADTKTDYPIDYRFYVKKGSDGFRTKIEIACELVRQAQSMPVSTIVWDRWYTCRELVETVEKTRKFWIGGCKSNLLVRWNGRYVSVEDWAQSLDRKKFRTVEVKGKNLLVYGRHLYIKSLGCVRRLIVSVRRSSSGREEILYLLTNRTDHMDAILGHYTLRWKIECFHKDAKQHLGVGRLQARSVVGIRRNWYLVFLAHALLRLGVSESSFGRTLIRSTGRKARKVCLDLLEDFISWVITTCNECGDQNKLHEIMEVFINR